MYIYMVLSLYVLALEPTIGKPHIHTDDLRSEHSVHWGRETCEFISRYLNFKAEHQISKSILKWGKGLICFLTMTLHCWLNIKNKMDGVSMNPDKTPIKCPVRSTQPWSSFLNLNHSVHNFWISMWREDRKEDQQGYLTEEKFMCIYLSCELSRQSLS